MFPNVKSGIAGIHSFQSKSMFKSGGRDMKTPIGYYDSGSAARFFYTAKCSQTDREGSNHPTMKPTDLMAYLCRLITPPGGLICDPFCGSGSTGKAAVQEGFRFIGIDKDAAYLEIARKRIWGPLFAGVINS